MNEDDGFYLIDEVAKMRKDFKRLKKENKMLEKELFYLRNLQAISEELENEFKSKNGDAFKLLIDKVANLHKRLMISEEALKFYSDPYNYTPDLDAMYGKNLNEKAFKALEEVKGME